MVCICVGGWGGGGVVLMQLPICCATYLFVFYTGTGLASRVWGTTSTASGTFSLWSPLRFERTTLQTAMEASPWSNYGWHTAGEELQTIPSAAAAAGLRQPPLHPCHAERLSYTVATAWKKDMSAFTQVQFLYSRICCCCSPCSSTSVLQLTHRSPGIYQCHTRRTDNSLQHSCQRNLAAL